MKTSAGKAERKRWKKTLVTKRMTHHTFTAIDGEGWDEGDEHEYMMIATSRDAHLYTGAPLRGEQCLDFIADLETAKGEYLVSFFFDYDVTMILRDFAREEPDKCRELFTAGLRSYVWWKGYGLRYRPHREFTVKRWTPDNSRKPVTIHDTQGFFQSSFVVALTKMGIGTEAEREQIRAMKTQRDSFTPDQAPEVLAYSQHECALLVSMIEKIRDLSHVAGINAEPYEGPGGMATRALGRHYGKELHRATLDNMPVGLTYAAPLAMYGGRFEILAVGAITVPVTEFDVHSAYPYAMTHLPCLIHGRWVYSIRRSGDYTLSHISFRDDRAPEPGLAYPLPVRRRSGELFYPREGSGWYWRHEYERDHLDVTVDCSYTWMPGRCECRPFEFIEEMYHQREDLEAEHKGSGIALKLTINTLYGKCAQQKPVQGPYLNFIYASLITSQLRARMYDYYSMLPRQSVVMFATDAIFTTAGPTALECTDMLGGMELANTYTDMVIVQPGLYFDNDTAHFKTRGIPKKYVAEHAEQIKAAAIAGDTFEFDIIQFKGLRLSLATGNLTDMGNWIQTHRTMKTRTDSKRIGETKIGGITWTTPAQNAQGESHSKAAAYAFEMERDQIDMESDGDDDQDQGA